MCCKCCCFIWCVNNWRRFVFFIYLCVTFLCCICLSKAPHAHSNNKNNNNRIIAAELLQQQQPHPTNTKLNRNYILWTYFIFDFFSLSCLSPSFNPIYIYITCVYNPVGNIRLSNSAESIQYAARRNNPNSSNIIVGSGINNSNSGSGGVNPRRLLMNVPRQYPLRSSLRRHKEKQIGGGSQSNSSNSISNEQLTGSGNTVGAATAAGGTPLNKPVLLVGLLPGAEQPPSVRNSIADCGVGVGLDYDKMDTMEHQLGLECSTTLSFKPPRL